MTGHRMIVVSHVGNGVLAAKNSPEGALLIEVTPDLGGAWTEFRDGREVIRFGYPKDSKSRWFQLERGPGRDHNVLSLALERTIHARGIEHVVCVDNACVSSVKRGLKRYGDRVRLDHADANGHLLKEPGSEGRGR